MSHSVKHYRAYEPSFLTTTVSQIISTSFFHYRILASRDNSSCKKTPFRAPVLQRKSNNLLTTCFSGASPFYSSKKNGAKKPPSYLFFNNHFHDQTIFPRERDEQQLLHTYTREAVSLLFFPSLTLRGEKNTAIRLLTNRITAPR